MKAREFDERFESGEEMIHLVDLSKARRVNLEKRAVNIDFPEWVISGLDQEAERIGVTRQSLIKLWIAERLERALPVR